MCGRCRVLILAKPVNVPGVRLSKDADHVFAETGITLLHSIRAMVFPSLNYDGYQNFEPSWNAGVFHTPLAHVLISKAGKRPTAMTSHASRPTCATQTMY